MKDWESKFREGKESNRCEDYSKAQELLELALEGCPDTDSEAISRIVFEIGRSFFGRGMRGVAISNMLAAVKMGLDEAHTENMMNALVNEYGMPLQNNPANNDEAAFAAIHVMRYLHSKRSGRFGTLAERDMIFELISDAWKDFRERVNLSGLKTLEKISRYRDYVIFFPVFTVPDEDNTAVERIIYADFGNDLCSCGSGLPFMWCCGRIKSIEELENGCF
jgi:hypothetical protein